MTPNGRQHRRVRFLRLRSSEGHERKRRLYIYSLGDGCPGSSASERDNAEEPHTRKLARLGVHDTVGRHQHRRPVGHTQTERAEWDAISHPVVTTAAPRILLIGQTIHRHD